MAVAYEIVLENFSGPLDLLLHLIQKNELDIYDIPIAMVTEQYLSYLHAMEELSLEIASEFAVMASTLLAIKSRMLLPKPESPEEEVLVEDPRQELVEQLLEYQRCKEGASQLKELSLLQNQVYSREAMDISGFTPLAPPRVEGVSIWQLVDTLRELLKRVPREDRVAEIRNAVINVEDIMESFLKRLRVFRSCSFFQLLNVSASRHEIVSAFVALLELIKNGQVFCSQTPPFGDIEIVYRKEDMLAGAHDSSD